MPTVSQPTSERQTIMGDKSPKSNQKKSTQKASKATAASLQKKQNTAASSAKPKK
jgi:hypothetical protein